MDFKKYFKYATFSSIGILSGKKKKRKPKYKQKNSRVIPGAKVSGVWTLALLTPQNPLDRKGREDKSFQTTSVFQEGWGV